MSTAAHPDASTVELPATVVQRNGEHCLSCGASLACDQRYCVDCGRRLGRARLPFMDDPARLAGSPQPPVQRVRRSASTALVAGVGTLLLAMGVGVLIGRSAPSGSRGSGPVQVLTVPASSAASGVGAAQGAGTAIEAAQTATGAAKAPAATKTGNTSKPSVKKSPPPPAKVVTVGSRGKGPGYKNGRFTGDFFGEGEK